MSLLGMVEMLATADVRLVVVGGVAMRALGSGCVTDDLDICYAPNPTNVRRLSDLLVSWNAYLRGAPRGLPFVADTRQFHTTPVMTLETDHGWIDVMDCVAGVGEYPAVLRDSIRIEVGPVTVSVLDVPALIRAKRATGRRKDRDQLPELEALLELRRGKR
jgi:hypothetical protein